MADQIFNCRVWQRGTNWHWQCMDDFEVVLALGTPKASNRLKAVLRVVASNAWAALPDLVKPLREDPPPWSKRSLSQRQRRIISATFGISLMPPLFGLP